MFARLTIRIKIAIYLIVVSLFGIVFVYIDHQYQDNESELASYQLNVQGIRTLVYKSLQLQGEFLLTDSRTTEFHIKATCDNLESFEQNIDSLIRLTGTMQAHEYTTTFNLTEDVLYLRDLILEHEHNLNDLKNKLLLKGFYNYGTEGELRLYVHELEDNYADVIPLADILQLRRTEKDYMLRHDLAYWKKNKALITKIKSELAEKEIADQMAVILINSYSEAFDAYVQLDTTIGFDRNKGLRQKIDRNAKDLLNQLEQLTLHAEARSTAYLSKIDLFFTLFAIAFFIALSILIYYAARNLSQPIIALSQGINAFIKSDYKEKTVFTNSKRQDEIGDLINDFNALQVEIADHFANFRVLSAKKQEKLERQKEKIQIQKYLMRESRNTLKEQVKYYASSLQYAQRIQLGILPNEKKITKMFGQVGLVYKPKDVVSGDFYWVYENDQYKYAAVVDCTGHGVPGAFMSMLGTSYLNYGVKDKGIRDTDELLNYLNSKVAEILGQYGENSEIKDGMDISLIRIDQYTNELQYSGAQRELIIVREGEIIRFKADRFPIGWILPGAKKKFTEQRIELRTNDLIVMYTDGSVDQFGGPKYKKFTRNQLYNLLTDSETMTAEEIANVVSINLATWKGNVDQTDDICLMAIRHENNAFLIPQKESHKNFAFIG